MVTRPLLALDEVLEDWPFVPLAPSAFGILGLDRSLGKASRPTENPGCPRDHRLHRR